MNFVIFNPDELRAESVGCYGHPLVQTPNMDRLAAEGVRFDQAHVQHTVCTPSRCSFMTGWYPHVRGHRTLWHCLRPEEPNLLKYLKQGGYEVAMFGKNDLLSPGSWDAGVDHLGSGKERSPHPSRVSEKDQPGYQNFLFEPKEGILDDLHDTDSVRLGIDFLSNRDTSKPFCLFLPLSYPHCPYTTVQPYYDMYDPDRLPPLRPAGKGEPDFHRLIREYRRLDEMEPQYLRKVNAVYLGMITALDAMLGRLLDALDEMNLADETAIIFLSDHGDWAGDRGLVEKWP
ncbi:MAG: sulfatase-like hydrolase/transferase, partial [Phycisphaerae bacterium]